MPTDQQQTIAETPFPAGAFAAALAWRLFVFALLWWLLTSGQQSAALFGVPFVAAAALLSALARFRPRADAATLSPVAPLSLLRLIGFFLWHSLLGGVDVALRAFRHPLPLQPDLIDYPLRLPPGPATVLMSGLVSLMPGTLSVICEDHLRVHVLDRHGHWHQDLERLERRIGAVYRLAGF
ncbi:MAG: Na+/H+ antiporter subunit E [Chromatiaceae bacterium]|nr:Na+/H+ antiporter subunit E [Chromatiaceae bacterium]MCF7996900.1 Na+/H+ antiporter subunit E [Chromatiaceae bacterium]MCF8014793.1 Na+/H+ antiporter subunit E [Chromatiaceae bacterium]